MRFFSRSHEEKVLDPPFNQTDPYRLPVSPRDLTWQLSTPGLTTQYKSFYFTFEDNTAGYIQYSYGNLGLLVKVAPMGFSFYPHGHQAIVASHTLRSSQMKLSEDNYSVNIGPHSLVMDEDHNGWRANIEDSELSYDLHFRIQSEAFCVQDFGRKGSVEQLRHNVIPTLTVTGTVCAHGKTIRVSGFGTYIEAFFAHVKFTDLCNQFTNFQLRSARSDEVLTMMQYVPRAGTSKGPLITFGSYTKDDKVVAICFQNKSVAQGSIEHQASGYHLPAGCAKQWSGTTVDGKDFKAACTFKTATPSSVTDVLSIFPAFFKDIVAIWAGLPFVFLWRVPETVATIEIGGVKHELRGVSSTELTHVHS